LASNILWSIHKYLFLSVYVKEETFFKPIFSRPSISSRNLLGRRVCAASNEKHGGDRVQQSPAIGKMRVAGDVLVRRPRGGQRQDHPPCCCPGSVHARRRGSLPKAGEWSRDTAGTKVYPDVYIKNYSYFSVTILTRNKGSDKCILVFKIKRRYIISAHVIFY